MPAAPPAVVTVVNRAVAPGRPLRREPLVDARVDGLDGGALLLQGGGDLDERVERRRRRAPRSRRRGSRGRYARQGSSRPNHGPETRVRPQPSREAGGQGPEAAQRSAGRKRVRHRPEREEDGKRHRRAITPAHVANTVPPGAISRARGQRVNPFATSGFASVCGTWHAVHTNRLPAISARLDGGRVPQVDVVARRNRHGPAGLGLVDDVARQAAVVGARDRQDAVHRVRDERRGGVERPRQDLAVARILRGVFERLRSRDAGHGRLLEAERASGTPTTGRCPKS